MKTCPACHEQLPLEARFCGACGFRLVIISGDAYQALASDKRKTGAPIALVRDAPVQPPPGSTSAPIPLTKPKRRAGAAPGVPAHAGSAERPAEPRLGDPASSSRTDMRGVHAPDSKHDTSRRARRFPLRVEVDYGSDHNFYTGFLENISSGGLFIATHELREIGDVIDVQFTVPGLKRDLVATVKVRWLREYNPSGDAPPGMGCQFGPLEADAKAAIELFLTHRDALFFDD